MQDPDVFMTGQKPNSPERELSEIEGDTTVMDESLDVTTTKAKGEMENDPHSNMRTEVEGTAISDHGYSNVARKELKSMKKQTLQTATDMMPESGSPATSQMLMHQMHHMMQAMIEKQQRETQLLRQTKH